MDQYGPGGSGGGYEQFVSKYAGQYMGGSSKKSKQPVSFVAEGGASEKQDTSSNSQSQGSQGGDYQKYMDYSKYTQGAQGGSQAGSAWLPAKESPNLP